MFRVGDIPSNLYRQEDGPTLRPALSLKNDLVHHLGEEPLPTARSASSEDQGSTLRFAGGNLSKYIPMNEDWEIDLGEIPGLVAGRASTFTSRIPSTSARIPSVIGWDIVEDWKVVSTNSRENSVRVEIDRN